MVRSCRDINYSKRDFVAVLSSCTNTGVMPLTRPPVLRYTPFPVHYSRVVLPFVAV